MLLTSYIPSWLKSRQVLLISIIIDFIIFFSFLPYGSYKLIINNFFVFLILPIYFIWFISNYIFGTYSDDIQSYSLLNLKDIFPKLIKSFLILIANIIIQFFFIKTINSTIPFLYIDITLVFLLIIFLRDLIIFFIGIFLLKKGYKNFNILFIGNSKVFEIFKQNLLSSEVKYKIKNINLNELSNYKDNRVSQIIIENDLILKDERFLEIYNQHNNFKKSSIYTLIDWSERYLNRYPPELLDTNSIINDFYTLDNKFISMRIKRVGDIAFSLVLLFLTSPIIFVSAIVIYLQDNGPILYSQIRVGRKGKEFRIYKLRSMKINSEKEGVQWSKYNDKRITKFGRIIRLFRIDELPQLISVLLGDMSLIGPRPERPEIIKLIEKEIPYYNLRNGVRPGISGWAQVNFPYGASIDDTKKKLSFDLYYIHNFNILIDILILLKTIKIVFRAKGAIAQK